MIQHLAFSYFVFTAGIYKKTGQLPWPVTLLAQTREKRPDNPMHPRFQKIMNIVKISITNGGHFVNGF
jgi:hypothetical protein